MNRSDSGAKSITGDNKSELVGKATTHAWPSAHALPRRQVNFRAAKHSPQSRYARSRGCRSCKKAPALASDEISMAWRKQGRGFQREVDLHRCYLGNPVTHGVGPIKHSNIFGWPYRVFYTIVYRFGFGSLG